MPTTAVQKLAPSRLLTTKQMELLGGDVNLEHFFMQIRQGAGIDVVAEITSAIIDRTIQGASTLTVSVEDDTERTIQRSGRLGHGVDVEVDGLFFTLVGVKKAGRSVSLTFEEREVNVLRRYKTPIFADRSKVTRAQFILRMIREVQEINLEWVIPELNIKSKPSDLTQNTILVDGTGKPLVGSGSLDDVTTVSQERQKGIANTGELTVKHVRATQEQINNAEIILRTGEKMGANRKVLISSIMTAICESTIHNLRGGDRDSVGVFQQRASQGWPASRNVATDAAAYFQRAIRYASQYPGIPYEMLCQFVQHSGTPDGSNYAPWFSEGVKFVDAFDKNPTMEQQAVIDASGTVDANSNLFMRGTITHSKGMAPGTYLLTPENSWNCMQRLADEVNWRCFVVSGKVYFVSENWLFKSKPFMVISEDRPGIDWIDYDYTEGKHKATCTVTAHMSRWSCPPGSCVQISEMGLINGKYLVEEISRSLFDNTATITLSKPLPILPEPLALAGVPSGFTGSIKTGDPPVPNPSNSPNVQNSVAANKVVAFAKRQLGLPYVYGAANPGSAFDCSGLTMCAYQTVGVRMPHNAGMQWRQGPRVPKGVALEAGDLVFFVTDGSRYDPGHVGIYIGGGKMIDAPHTGSVVRVDRVQGFDVYVGATRPWMSKNVTNPTHPGQNP